MPRDCYRSSSSLNHPLLNVGSHTYLMNMSRGKELNSIGQLLLEKSEYSIMIWSMEGVAAELQVYLGSGSFVKADNCRTNDAVRH